MSDYTRILRRLARAAGPAVLDSIEADIDDADLSRSQREDLLADLDDLRASHRPPRTSAPGGHLCERYGCERRAPYGSPYCDAPDCRRLRQLQQERGRRYVGREVSAVPSRDEEWARALSEASK